MPGHVIAGWAPFARLASVAAWRETSRQQLLDVVGFADERTQVELALRITCSAKAPGSLPKIDGARHFLRNALTPPTERGWCANSDFHFPAGCWRAGTPLFTCFNANQGRSKGLFT
jgi:hypothetical protein